MAIVYLHRKKDIQDPFLNVFYVGISKNYRRPTIKYKRNSMWNRIVKKHGYQIEITHENISWEEACSIEKYLISFYGRHDLELGNLTNMTDGGDGAVNYIRSEEQNKVHGEKMKGENNPMFGRSAQAGRNGFFTGGKHSEESKRKISESLKKSMTLEVRKKMSESRTGVKNYLYGKRGKETPNFGRKHSQETILKMKLSWQKRKEKNESITD